MLDDLVAHYGETSSQVLRIALSHLYESVTATAPVNAPEPAVS